MTPDEFDIEETIDAARDFLRRGVVELVDGRDFMRAVVQLADTCVIGIPCTKHAGAIHGQEAEELRAGVEQALQNTADVREDEAAFVLSELRKALIFLLDRIDARDSLAFREATDTSETSAP